MSFALAAAVLLWLACCSIACHGSGASDGTSAAGRAPQVHWQNVEPGGGGWFECVGAGPTGIVLAGSDLSGAYISRDRGRTWTCLGGANGLNATHVASVGFDLSNRDIFYVGTDNGLYRTTDGGRSLHLVCDGLFKDVKFAPDDPAIGYAAVHPAWNSDAGQVYRSDDRGVTWKRVSVDLPDTNCRIQKLLLTSNKQMLYLLAAKDRFAGASGRLLASADGGVHWRDIGADLGDVTDVDVDPADPSTLYATNWISDGKWLWHGFVYKTVDGGETWQQKAPHTGAILVKRDRPSVIRVIDVERRPHHEEAGTWESTDGGETWAKKANPGSWTLGWQTGAPGSSSSYAKTLGRDLSDSDAIYWVDTQFVYGSFDGGAHFENLSTDEVAPGRWRTRGISNTDTLCLAISKADGRVYAGLFDVGIWQSADHGDSWKNANDPQYSWPAVGGNTNTIVADPTRAGVVWCTQSLDQVPTKATLLKSVDGGATWVRSDQGLGQGYLSGLSISRSSPAARRVLFVTKGGAAYRSADDGATWERVSSDEGLNFTAVDRINDSIVYAGGAKGLYVSLAAGAPGSWKRVGDDAFAAEGDPIALQHERSRYQGVFDIVPDPSHEGWVYVVAFKPGGGLYLSKDAGQMWKKLHSTDYQRSVAIDPRDSNTILLAASKAYTHGGNPGGSEGILRSADGGATWSDINGNLVWPFVIAVAVDESNPDWVFIGTAGSGFHKARFPR